MKKYLQEQETNFRKKLAKKQGCKKVVGKSSPDLVQVPYYIGSFSKGLKHDNQGIPEPSQMKQLLKRIENPFTHGPVHLTGSFKLEDPVCTASFELFCPNSACYQCKPAPFLSSRETGAEMEQLYAMALLRDVPFSKYTTSPEVKKVATSLKTSPELLFRGPSSGEQKGMYISQFLYHPFKYGPLEVEQKYSTPVPNVNYMTTLDQAIKVQNGEVTEKMHPLGKKKYLQTMRDGAAWVQADLPTQGAINAACLLMTMGVPRNPAAPKVEGENSFVNFGTVDMLDAINRVSRLAFLACWQHKWQQMRLRPEAYGIQVEMVQLTNDNRYHLDQHLLNSPILAEVRSKQGSSLLSQCTPQGCPTHPAYPSGHSVIAGATITVLKAYFDCRGMMKVLKPSADGQRLIDTEEMVNINDELDKLAANIGVFRCGAGYHYSSDNIEGLKLGEDIAISFLKEAVQRYKLGGGYYIKKRDGTEVLIGN